MRGRLGPLAVTEPKEKPEDTAKGERACEKQASRWYSHQAHHENAKNNQQPDGVAGEVTSTIEAERAKFGWGEVVVVRGRWPSTAPVGVDAGVH